jgi:hypothetical protein
LSASHEEYLIFLVDFQSNIPIKYNVKVFFLVGLMLGIWESTGHPAKPIFIPFLNVSLRQKEVNLPKLYCNKKHYGAKG